jgi:hypothetical protein
MQLPPALQAWAEPLSALDAELAIALGPLVRQLDQLITRQDLGSGTHGPLDGYDGITRQGDPTRLLISEWALADTVPDEFLRRAANAELLYLEPAYQQDRQRARVAVLVDTGPDQLGAGRLVQLAALIVLLRRAAARGHELALGVLGDEPGSWRSGEPTVILRNWLASRRADDPDPQTIDEWAAADNEEIWILAGPRLAKELPGRRRLLVTRECAWDDHGSTAAEVRLAGDRVELALPRHDIAIRALRGAAFRRSAASTAAVSGGTRFARFTGSPRRLVARHNETNELLTLTISQSGESKPKRYHLPGPVVAAGTFNKRLVTLILIEDTLRVETIGKPLGHLGQLAVLLADLDLTVADINELLQHDLLPLYYQAGAILCRLGDQWWRLSRQEPPERYAAVAVATGSQLDAPRTAVPNGSGMIVTGPWRRFESTVRVVFGDKDLVARFDGLDWRIVLLHGGDGDYGYTVEVPTDAEPFGVLDLNHRLTLLCYTEADGTVQLCTPDGSRTLSNLPPVLRTPSLHPFIPLLAVELEDRVDVIDLTDESLAATLRGDA